MNGFRPLLIALTALLLPAGFAARAGAETLTVGDPGLATIQAAVDAALSNADLQDTVLVPSGSYDESVAIVLTNADLQQKLTLRRKGKSGDVLITGQGGLPAVQIDGLNGVCLKNLVLDSGSFMDGVPALEMLGTTRNVDCSGVNGTPGDDVGVIIGQTVVGVRLQGSDFSGMLGVGFVVDGASHTLSDCVASACGLNGIVFRSTALNCVVDGCVAIAAAAPASADPGVISIDGQGHLVTDTTAGGAGAGGDGFFVEGSGHRLSKCVSMGNSRAGFNLNVAVVRLDKCQGSENLFGVQGGGQGTVIDGGKFDQNSSHGVLLLQPGTFVTSISADSNIGSGVYVQTGVVGSRILDCSFRENGAEGVFVLGSFTWLEGNVGRKGDGFVDAGTLNSGRDNKAKGGGVNDF